MPIHMSARPGGPAACGGSFARVGSIPWYADISLLGIDFVGILIQFTLLVVSLSVHEAAHAWSAEKLGDPTARTLGRVTLNPAAHVDPIGTILFPLLAMASNLPLIGWAKPVPVGIQNLRGNWRQKFMFIAAAGPASNILMALAGAAALWILSGGPPLQVAQGLPGQILFAFVQLNLLLAVFNMVPVPPLDGGNVLAGLVSGPIADALDRVRPYGILILYALMFLGVFSQIIYPVVLALQDLLL
jgi:Zn-dependent protease